MKKHPSICRLALSGCVLEDLSDASTLLSQIDRDSQMENVNLIGCNLGNNIELFKPVTQKQKLKLMLVKNNLGADVCKVIMENMKSGKIVSGRID